MAIMIAATTQQEASAAELVERHEDHDAWVDFVTTDDHGTVWLRFTHWNEPAYEYAIATDGTVT